MDQNFDFQNVNDEKSGDDLRLTSQYLSGEEKPGDDLKLTEIPKTGKILF